MILHRIQLVEGWTTQQAIAAVRSNPAIVQELTEAELALDRLMPALELEGGKEGAFAALNRLRVWSISNNLGDAKSIATHPATTTHQRLSDADRATLGIGPGLIRLSVGLEHPDDLIADLLGAIG